MTVMTEPQSFWDKHPQPWKYYKTSAVFPKYVVTDNRHAEVFETADEQIAAVLCTVVNNIRLISPAIEMTPLTISKQSVGLEPIRVAKLRRPPFGTPQS